MPPKSAKKNTAGPGSRRGARASRAKPKVVEDDENKVVEQETKVVAEDDNKVVEDVKVVEEDEIKVVEETKVVEDVEDVEVKVVEETIIENEPESDSKKEDSVKESVEEYERDERLDLDDNEHEEYGGLDYDEKETDLEEDVQEDGEDVEEEMEADASEDDVDLIGDKNEVAHEKVEDEDDEEHAGEENTDMTDTEKQEHHDVVQERRKRKEFEIFVGGLDKEATEDDLRKVFSEVGEVTEVRLMMNPQTKKNKGFAFLRFATVEQAKRACAEMKNTLVNGKRCGVSPSQDNDTLFLGNICKTWTKAALQDKLKHYGVVNVEDVTLVEDGNNEGFNRGFAFLEFSSKAEAKDAFKLLQGNVVFGVDKPAKVSFADSFIDPGDEIMAQVKTVFVDGLPASWDEDRVKELLKGFGHVEKIELARNMPSAKRRDFGFVTFDTHDAAVTCAKSINNQELGEGETKAKVRARLSRPDRGQGQHAGRDYRPARGPARSARAPWSRSVPRSLPVRGVRGSGSRLPPLPNRGMKRPAAFRDRRPVMSRPVRSRPLPPPPRSYERRPPVPVYPKGPIKRDYARRDEPPPRGRAPPEYASRPVSERRPSYREEYSPRGSGGVSGYSDFPRSASRSSARRPYVDEGYGPKYERPPPSYREGRGRDYDAVPGTKRSYSAIDDIPPRYADTGVRQPRARLDYELGASGSHYGDAYNDRLGRSSLGYGSTRTSLSSQDSHGLYGSRHGMSYSGSSVGGSDGGGMYSSSYDGDYVSSRGPDVGSGSYSSLYSSRGLSGSSYMGSGSSGSYY